MVKLFTALLTLVVALSFGGLTFAKSLGDHSSIQNSFPLNADGDKDGDDKDKKDEGTKMDDKKDDENKDGEKGEK
jgi:hypothetical protein